MKLLALVKGPPSISRDLATVGEATEVSRRSPGRGPPYWKSRVLRLKVLGDEDVARGPRPRGRRGGSVAAGATAWVDHGAVECARGAGLARPSTSGRG